MRKLIVILIAVCAAALSAAACMAPPPPAPRADAVVYGDSLIGEASPYLHGDVRGFSGTALCDWTDEIVNLSNTYHPRVIVLSFIGNNVTPCMDGTMTEQAVRDRYFVYMTSLKQRIPNQRLLWVVQPIIHDALGYDREPTPNPLYEAEPWHVDAGAAIEGLNGEYLPQYRDADGLHLNDEGARLFANAINRAQEGN